MSAQQLQEKLAVTRSELESVKAQIAALQRSAQLADMTKKQIHTEIPSSDGAVWQGIGKMFLRTSVDDYDNSLDLRQSEANDQVKALKIKENYFSTTLENLTKAVLEMTAK